MRLTFIFFSFLSISSLIGQSDTIVIADLTEVMLEVDRYGKLSTITDFEELDIAGFFLEEESLYGAIRVCNNDETYLYVNGRLLDVFSSCVFFDLESLKVPFKSDPLFLSLYSKGGLENIKCEHVIFDTLQIVKETTGSNRSARDLLNEFLIIAMIVTLLSYGWIISTNQARRSYLLRKSFSLKLSSYEFVNTTFLSQSNFQFLVLLSLLIGLLFSSSTFHAEEEINLSTLSGLVFRWLSITGLTLVLLFVKYIFSSLVSFLFKFRKMNDYQLFDFENFMLLSLSFVSALFVGGYLLFKPLQFFIQSHINLIIVLLLMSFLAWFGLKFVNNSSRKKLQIISYLCATEMIPTILLYIEISK